MIIIIIIIIIIIGPLKEPAIYLHKLEQLKLCNLSYIREYERF